MTNSRAGWAVWRHRDFRWLGLGQGLSWLGDAFQPVALAAGVLLHGGSATDLGVILALGMATRVLCMPVAGVWADRLLPQRIMVLADVVRFGSALGISALFATDGWSVGPIAALTVISSAAGAFFMPAFIALKPNLVPAADRQSANAMLTMLSTGAMIIGSASGGALVAFVGSSIGFLINGVSFAFSAFCVTKVRVRSVRQQRSGFGSELRGGLRAIASRPWLRAGTLSATAYHLGNGMLLVLIPSIAIHQLGGAVALGLVETATGVGGLIGGIVAMRVRMTHPLRLAWPMLAILPIGLLSYVWPQRLVVVLICTIAGYLALMFLDVLWETAIQQQVPAEQLARVGSWDALLSWAVLPIGSALAGPLAGAFGIDRVFVVACSAMAVTALLPLLSRSTRDLRSSPATGEEHRPVALPGG
ncbi:MFS transporter [Microlunatus soli]|uniref:Predicted arabinose efflux permease, MFS family n=1 Tax=Microlunatus soli TaxID=630515 RepID=A0A1H1ZXG3_9ACTN|nr:MFS transporter [Microlunatus soli]SDT37936.1 Predicted arabinose efflux permease, MFS family [Microlunatus soli]